MALIILDTCINCHACEPLCPSQAITEGAVIYEIAANRCTECVGDYDAPQCQQICPIEACIVINPNCRETPDTLLQKRKQLHP